MSDKLSAEQVVETLRRVGVPQSFAELATELGVNDKPGKRTLTRVLQQLGEAGQVVCNRRGAFGLTQEMDLVAGVVLGHANGFGFVRTDREGPDWFLPPRQMERVFPGDRVLVRLAGHDQRGKPEASIVDVLECNTQQIIGHYAEEAGVGIVIPEMATTTHTVLIPPEWRNEATPGQIVRVAIRTQPRRRVQAVGEVVELLGDEMNARLRIDAAIVDYGLPNEFSPALLSQAENLPRPQPAADRHDCREWEFVTIDGEDAKDFDDAVLAQRIESGWMLWVAIADVSAYVEPGTALDDEARLRGNSVYFPGRVVPMLPPRISDDLCSLRPEEDRYAMICEMRLSKTGELRATNFYPGLIRSRARLIYEDVAQALENPDCAHPQRALLEPLRDVYKALSTARERRGALDFDSAEVQVVLDEDGAISGVRSRERTIAHRLIEECMILANVATAQFLRERNLPFLARIHESPPPLQLADLREFLAEWQLQLGGGDEPSPQDFARVLQSVAGRAEAGLVESVLLRSLAQARYAPSDSGHFGLALVDYAHFTSPIRRYPDLIIHRTIRHALAGGDAQSLPWSHADLVALGEHCSTTDRRAEHASYDVIGALKCDFLADRIGEEFEGRITGVTAFGLFVEIDEVRASGLVHISALGNDYYHHESKFHRLRGARNGRLYRLGDSMRVKLARVDAQERKIDFEPLAHLAAIATSRREKVPQWRDV